MKYFVIIALVGILPLMSSSYALEENSIIVMPFAKVEPIIDGKFTSEDEWNDASVTNFQSNDYDFYLQVKHDNDFVYLMLDGVDFQTNPKDDSISVSYQAFICFDTSDDGGTKKQPDDVCFVSTEYNEFGDHIRTENAELRYTLDGESNDRSMEHVHQASWGFGSENDPFEEKVDHLMYELQIEKSFPITSNNFGFNFRVYFGSSSSDVVQLIDGVIWPPDSNADEPSTWGTISSLASLTPKKQIDIGILFTDVNCKKGLELILKSSDNSPACVKPSTAEKLIERGWGVMPEPRTEPGPEPYDATLLERYKDEPEVKAFYARYDNVDDYVRDNRVNFAAGNEDDFRARLSLYFDENFEKTHMRFYCFVGGELQHEVAQEDILHYLQNYHCLTYKTGE